jgi:predicted P-loop ATPase
MGIELRHDTFSNRLLIDGEILDDAAAIALWFDIELRYGFRSSKELFIDVVEDLARTNAFHPVRDYLDSLVWDGVERASSWLSTYAGVEETPYSRAVGRIFLVAAVRRIRRPGCKFDEMLVLESPQGGLKSSLLETLAVREEWFSDDIPLNADGKKFIEQAQGRWILEAADLAGMRRADVEHLKATLSRRVDKARLSYGRLPVERPRQCIAAGTTNDDRYLRDTTGNRRFWPVRVGEIDLAGLRDDRDQLWAEAAAIEARGETIRLSPDLYPEAAREQAGREVVSALQEQVTALFEGREGRVRSSELTLALGLTKYDNTATVRDAMARVGWKKDRARFADGTNVQAYLRNHRSCREELRVSRQADGRVEVAIERGAPIKPPF